MGIGSKMRAVVAGLLLVVVAACGGERPDPDLINIRRGQNTPDEFAVLPSKPIELPQDLSALPEPTPGASNRVDPTPRADAVAALGGNPGRLRSEGVPRADAALISHAGRNGVRPDIRKELAAADLAFRQKNRGRVLERAFNVTTYYKAYRRWSLDKEREVERFRRAGVRTPAVPPAP